MLGCLALVLLPFLTSCAARLGQFSQFAATGQTYAVALPAVLDVALQSTIDANSSELIAGRDNIRDRKERADELGKSDDEIRRRARAFQAIKTQTHLLGAYFTGIAALAESDAGAGLGKSTADAADALARISQDAAALQIGTASVKDALGEGVPIVVAAFKHARLEAVLKGTAESVGRSLDIHIALLDRLGEVIRGEQEVAIRNTKLVEIDRKYTEDGALPKRWKERRAELLLQEARLGELEEALQAAQKLKLAFVALVENQKPTASLTLLLQDVQRLISLAERISGESPGEGG
jgi:hypothetical protein